MISPTETLRPTVALPPRPTVALPPRPSCFGYYTRIADKCRSCIDRTACVGTSAVVISPQLIGSATVRIEKDGKFYVQVNLGKTTVKATISMHETP